jgi:hypothetical protein
MRFSPEEKQKYIDELKASIEEGERLVRGKGRLVSPILMKAEGANGQLLLLEDSVRIKRREATAFLNQGLQSDRIIPLAQIASVQLKNAGAFANGYIRFTIKGENKIKAADITQDDNTIIFKAAQQPPFDKIKTAIETKMSTAKLPGPTNIPQSKSFTYQYIDELEKLASLRDRGIITEEEFADKKRKILGI